MINLALEDRLYRGVDKISWEIRSVGWLANAESQPAVTKCCALIGTIKDYSVLGAFSIFPSISHAIARRLRRNFEMVGELKFDLDLFHSSYLEKWGDFVTAQSGLSSKPPLDATSGEIIAKQGTRIDCAAIAAEKLPAPSDFGIQYLTGIQLHHTKGTAGINRQFELTLPDTGCSPEDALAVIKTTFEVCKTYLDVQPSTGTGWS